MNCDNKRDRKRLYIERVIYAIILNDIALCYKEVPNGWHKNKYLPTYDGFNKDGIKNLMIVKLIINVFQNLINSQSNWLLWYYNQDKWKI